MAEAPRQPDQPYEVKTQTPGVTDEMLAESKKLLGVILRGNRATLEITADKIKDYCNYMGSQNPLFLDETYARKTRWGGIIAPPTIIYGPALVAPGLRGLQFVNGGTDWEWFHTVRPGDTITTLGRLIDSQEKRGQNVKRMLIQIGEITYFNQRDELVARCVKYTMRTPRARAAGGMRYEARLQKYSPAEVEAIEQAILKEKIRGAEPRYWEDVQVGEEMPSVIYGPLRTLDIAVAGYVDFSPGTSAAPGGHVYQLLRRRQHPADAYLDPETGVQGHPYRGHWEEFMAREVGMPGIYDVGVQRLTWPCRFITDWMGDNAFLKKLSTRLRRPNVVADTTWMKGKVKQKSVQNEEHLVECEIWMENQTGEVTTTTSATVVLPSKSVPASATASQTGRQRAGV